MAIGRIARGNSTLFSSPPLSTIAPVDIAAELAKNVHAEQAEHQVEHEALAPRVRRMNVKAIV